MNFNIINVGIIHANLQNNAKNNKIALKLGILAFKNTACMHLFIQRLYKRIKMGKIKQYAKQVMNVMRVINVTKKISVNKS